MTRKPQAHQRSSQRTWREYVKTSLHSLLHACAIFGAASGTASEKPTPHNTLRTPTPHPSSSYHHYRRKKETSAQLNPKQSPQQRRINIPQLEVLAPLQRQLRLGLALRAFQPQHDLLRRLGLLVEHRFGLSSVPGLLAVVAALSLREERCLLRNCGQNRM